MRDLDSEETLRRTQREQRRARLHREQRRKARQRQMIALCCAGILVVVLAAAGIWLLAGKKDGMVSQGGSPGTEASATEDRSGIPDGNTGEAIPDADAGKAEEGTAQGAFSKESADDPTDNVSENRQEPETSGLFAAGYQPEATDATAVIGGEDVLSNHALLVDLDNNTIIAQKGAYDRISPASMTKILTVLVAAEHIDDLEDSFTVTREITDYSYGNDCSAAGFEDGETVTVKDLLYGTILPSGADAAAGLAYYVSGSLEDFVALMNEKLTELGLSDSAHFTNCVGLYDENHYCTSYDMAVMLKAAVENDLCREVLSAHIYTTSSTEQHPEGLELSNWFLRRIEDKETNGEVVCAKTGYVLQSGNCAASYEVSASGKHYICVTADTYSSWRCIYDHVAIYQKYTE